jgi:peroxiredoxin family protein
MYKILITTTYSTMNGCSISSIVVDFEIKDKANAVIEAIKEQQNSLHVNVSAIPLYQP